MFDDKKHILVVDDDTRLRSLLEKYLLENNFFVSVAKDAFEAEALITQYAFDLIILDVMMPKKSGTEFLKDLREHHNIPVILLTAMGETADKINGLELGADDYLTKPFEPKELILRMHNVLKRIGESLVKDTINLGEYVFDLQKKELSLKNGSVVHITPVEQTILFELAKKIGIVFSREKLAEMLDSEQSPRSIDVQITRLRKKIEKDSKNPRYIQTVRSKGYVLLVD
ncbi:MAG: response regulator [Alphaproteobacteria bacterium]